MANFIVGLTGGIGSGKSAVTGIFAEFGIVIVDADIAAREVVVKGSSALQQIADRHGDGILNNEGALDRAQLRKIIFSNPAEKDWLEALLHPLIGETIDSQLAQANSTYAILVSPLLIEAKQFDRCQRILVVDVPEELQINRTMARDNNDVEQVKRIIASQLSRNKRLDYADDVIENTDTLASLRQRVEELHTQYEKIAATKNND